MKFSRNRTGVAGDFALECVMITHLDERKARSMMECV
jgi:hypothetical protein